MKRKTLVALIFAYACEGTSIQPQVIRADGSDDFDISDQASEVVVSHDVTTDGPAQDVDAVTDISTLDSMSDAVDGGQSAFTSVSVGRTHACAIAGGGVYCWGSNSKGQIGLAVVSTSTVTQLLVPSFKRSPVVTNAAEVIAANEFTCARLFNGDVKCWGRNDYGQLGQNGTTEYSHVPLSAQLPRSAKSISAYEDHVCALIESVGDATRTDLFCWGTNANDHRASYRDVDRISPPAFPSQGGFLVKDLVGAVFGAGKNHSCLIASYPDGPQMRCFGEGRPGQLGAPYQTLETQNAVYFIRPVSSTAQLTHYQRVKGGGYFTCGMRGSDTDLYCWGNGPNYQLGSGAKINSHVPARVKLPDGEVVLDFALGDNHACAATMSKKLFCWGKNNNFQAGNSNPEDVQNPTPILGNTSILSLSANTDHTCFVTADGTVRCFGENKYWQLGYKTVGDNPSAVAQPVVFE